jgi:hypothetical protein
MPQIVTNRGCKGTYFFFISKFILNIYFKYLDYQMFFYTIFFDKVF